MAKVVCKGTIIEYDVGTPVAVGQIISISHEGAESETFDSTTLDTSGAGKEYTATGYSEGGTITLEVFFDPVLVNHTAIQALITTPAEQDWQITFADAGATVQRFDSAGVGYDFSVDMNDGLKATFTLKLDQLLVYTP